VAVERLQKLIAHAGLASRREAERWIADGRVRVNGKVIRDQGTKADPETDDIEVDGDPLTLTEEHTYILLWKPEGYVTTTSHELGRPTVLDLIEAPGRVYPVGRLDFDAEGLLLLTDDGDLTNRLTHPSSEVRKTYHAKVRGRPSEAALEQLLQGVHLEDGLARCTHADHVQLPGQKSKSNTWIELTVTEGRNHLIKRLCEHIGHPLVRLRRVRFATLGLDGLRRGKHRALTAKEVRHLQATTPKKNA
jgi:pseudouridine synthase